MFLKYNMKHIYLLLILSFSLFNAQKIDKDIFNNYQYQSKKSNFSASLKKDIFNNIIYSDDNQNEITFEHKYVAKY